MASMTPSITVTRNKDDRVPDHHVLEKMLPWSSYIGSWAAPRITTKKGQDEALVSSNGPRSFKNPWPSFHKPTTAEKIRSLSYGMDQDPCIQLALSHLPGIDIVDTSQASRTEQASRLLWTERPDFSFDGSKQQSKSTWLGHASMLLQLPPLHIDRQPIRILFDPIFSLRCSPSQSIGPIRSYPPPCPIEDLPSIDVVLISHNHYDHLDYDTIKALWQANDTVQFIVPLGNKRWFLECGIRADRIEELDWWETATFAIAGIDAGFLQFHCTPAQHSSGRDGFDTNKTLWSSWFLEHKAVNKEPYRIFFAGDSGYQFHGDPVWPPQPPIRLLETVFGKSLGSEGTETPYSHDEKHTEQKEDYPPCPAFKEIASRLGSPHLLYLPLALGATWAYLKSFTSNYLPDSIDPFPRHSAGVTGAIHMPPWDAVRVLNVMTDAFTDKNTVVKPVAIGIHWGTYVTDKTEVLKTLGQLEWACDQQDVRFLRNLDESRQMWETVFIALNHGQSVVT